jgi:Ca2+-binding EF-hand superfamily protein
VLALAALPLGATALAEQGQGNMRFRGMDRNGDGRISRAEWRGSAQSFRNHDWNGDGVLSGDEIRPNGRRDESDDQFGTSRPVFDDWTAEGFSYLDRNRDNRVTRNEWFDDQASFNRADRNDDNVLSRAEFLAMGSSAGSDVREQRFDTMDSNNNGRIERREWTGNPDRFDTLDVNNDNSLTRAEFGVPGDFDTPREDRFETMDTNNNGRIERREWTGRADRFDVLDTNNDNVISRAEMLGNADDAESDVFRAADNNRDNRLSQNEWRWTRREFLLQDTDRNGYVERQEFYAPTSAVGTSGRFPEADNRPLNTPVVVNVSGRERWVDTGIDTREGDILRISSTGSVRLSGNWSDTSTPAGANRQATNAPMPYHPAGSLIARISNGTPFFVGNGTNVERAPQAGRLYLMVNDDHLDDNSGSYRVTIIVRPQ